MNAYLLIFIPLAGAALAAFWPNERTRPFLLPAFAAAPKDAAPAAVDIAYEQFTLPTFRSPLLDESKGMRFRDEVDHAFFLRCCELYRVLEGIAEATAQISKLFSGVLSDRWRNRKVEQARRAVKRTEAETVLVYEERPEEDRPPEYPRRSGRED